MSDTPPQGYDADPATPEKDVTIFFKAQPAWRDAVQDATRHAQMRSFADLIDRAVAMYCREVILYPKAIPTRLRKD